MPGFLPWPDVGQHEAHCQRRRDSVGCVRQYCYCRERKYCPFDDLDDFGYVLKVKKNAPEVLRRGLACTPVDMVATGDYQAAENALEVSRRMLEVCLELGFPVSVLERSPLVVRDLELIKETNVRAPSVVFLSMISAPDSPSYGRVRPTPTVRLLLKFH
jgi:DNA repair photolyase